ncbi:MAG: class I SAM-dependent methyltransferase, partial [Dehalococcoidia bacterium]
VDRNRSRAGELKTPNIWFEREDVRDISTEERFDLVLCIATLHYIKDIRKALRDLYARVDHGGFLIFNYPNRPSMYGFRDWIEKEAPELRNRYRLVLGGENLLTLDDIKETLGKRPVNFWRAVGEQPSRLNMCVYLEKGQV